MYGADTIYAAVAGELITYHKELINPRLKLPRPAFSLLEPVEFLREGSPVNVSLDLGIKGDYLPDLQPEDLQTPHNFVQIKTHKGTSSDPWWSNFTIIPRFESGQIILPAGTYTDQNGNPNQEVVYNFLEIYRSMTPVVNYDSSPMNYDEQRTIEILFDLEVEEFTKETFPWTLFDAELISLDPLPGGYALTIAPIHKGGSVISFTLDDGFVSSRYFPRIKNYAIPETKIFVKSLPH